MSENQMKKATAHRVRELHRDFAADLANWMEILVILWRSRTSVSKAARQFPGRLSDSEVKELATAVKRLSRGFTGNRRLVGTQYLSDPGLLGAYLLFYWPVSYVQARTVLSDLDSRGYLSKKEEAIDLGSGPCPMACAALDIGYRTVTALEQVPEALELASELIKSAGSTYKGRLKTHMFHADTLIHAANHKGSDRFDARDKPERSVNAKDFHMGKVDLITCGHLLNEIGTVSTHDGKAPRQTMQTRFNLTAACLSHLSQSGSLVLVEPALRSTTRNLLTLRDMMVESGARIQGPCFYSGPCPVLKTPDQTCHGQVLWTMPDAVRRLSEESRIDKTETAMAWLSLAPSLNTRNTGKTEIVLEASTVGTPPESVVDSTARKLAVPQDTDTGEGPWRVVSDAMLNKAGRTRYMICGPKGRIGLSLKRGSLINGGPDSRETEAVFFSLNRGDVVTLKNPENRENGLGLIHESILKSV